MIDPNDEHDYDERLCDVIEAMFYIGDNNHRYVSQRMERLSRDLADRAYVIGERKRKIHKKGT